MTKKTGVDGFNNNGRITKPTYNRGGRRSASAGPRNIVELLRSLKAEEKEKAKQREKAKKEEASEDYVLEEEESEEGSASGDEAMEVEDEEDQDEAAIPPEEKKAKEDKIMAAVAAHEGYQLQRRLRYKQHNKWLDAKYADFKDQHGISDDQIDPRTIIPDDEGGRYVLVVDQENGDIVYDEATKQWVDKKGRVLRPGGKEKNLRGEEQADGMDIFFGPSDERP